MNTAILLLVTALLITASVVVMRSVVQAIWREISGLTDEEEDQAERRDEEHPTLNAQHRTSK